MPPCVKRLRLHYYSRLDACKLNRHSIPCVSFERLIIHGRVCIFSILRLVALRNFQADNLTGVFFFIFTRDIKWNNNICIRIQFLHLNMDYLGARCGDNMRMSIADEASRSVLHPIHAKRNNTIKQRISVSWLWNDGWIAGFSWWICIRRPEPATSNGKIRPSS